MPVTQEFIESLMKQNQMLLEQNNTLIEQVDSLSKTIDELNATIKELREQLNKNSGNSSKPLSSDGFKKVPKSLREKSGKKRGGQKGHQGTHLAVLSKRVNTLGLEKYADRMWQRGKTAYLAYAIQNIPRKTRNALSDDDIDAA